MGNRPVSATEDRTERGFSQSALSERDFQRLSKFIELNLGIRMPATKRIMLEARLSRRLRQNGMEGFPEYVDYLFSEAGMRTELIHMIDAVTTNKTDFFREADHFDFLLTRLLPAAVRNRGLGTSQPMSFWSAGCATGEEPYTLAMTLEEFRATCADFRYSIFASDISSRALDTAAQAVYDMDKADPVPLPFKKKYMLKSKDAAKPRVRMKSELREKVTFARINLMDDDFSLSRKFDVIFCRNVIIYFDRKTQERLIRHLHDCLEREGTLFLGHSETLAGMVVPFRSVAPTVYRKD
jgi:chemotaxis protein methyltransferase CheR